MQQRTAWIWMVGSGAWIFDGLIAVHFHAVAHAVVAFLIAVLFFVAWLFYSRQPPTRRQL